MLRVCQQSLCWTYKTSAVCSMPEAYCLQGLHVQQCALGQSGWVQVCAPEIDGHFVNQIYFIDMRLLSCYTHVPAQSHMHNCLQCNVPVQTSSFTAGIRVQHFLGDQLAYVIPQGYCQACLSGTTSLSCPEVSLALLIMSPLWICCRNSMPCTAAAHEIVAPQTASTCTAMGHAHRAAQSAHDQWHPVSASSQSLMIMDEDGTDYSSSGSSQTEHHARQAACPLHVPHPSPGSTRCPRQASPL